MTEAELAWVSGLFEGEGCITRIPNIRGPRLQLNSCDKDVILRCHQLTGVGTVLGPYVQGGHKPQWRWSVYKRSDVARLLMDMFPWLGERRQARALEGLSSWSRDRRPTSPKGVV